MAGRSLVAGKPSRELDEDYVSRREAISDERTMPVPQLIAGPAQIAVDMSAALLAGFGWHANLDVLSDYQAELLSGINPQPVLPRP